MCNWHDSFIVKKIFWNHEFSNVPKVFFFFKKKLFTPYEYKSSRLAQESNS